MVEIFARILKFRHPVWWRFSTESVNSGTQFGRFAWICKVWHPLWWKYSTHFAATVRGSVGPFIQSNAAVVIKGETVLKRVGATRQPSSQASLPQIPSEQSRKQTIGLHWPSTTDSIRAEPETETFIMNQMLTHYRINRNRKIPGGCTQPATGMPSESARIVKVDT